MDDLTPYLVILAGGIALWKVASLILKARSIDFWPKVRGKVVISLVDDQSGMNGGSYQFSYKAEVIYRFEVDNVGYKGSGIGLDESSYFMKFLAKRIVEKYPENSEVIVFYNPEDPHESYLKKEASLLTYFFLSTIGFVFLGIGFLDILFK